MFHVFKSCSSYMSIQTLVKLIQRQDNLALANLFRLQRQKIGSHNLFNKAYNSSVLTKTLTFHTLQVDLSALKQQETDLATMAQEMDNYFQTELLYKRNEIMAERITNILSDNPNESFFFAFGAGKTKMSICQLSTMQTKLLVQKLVTVLQQMGC